MRCRAFPLLILPLLAGCPGNDRPTPPPRVVTVAVPTPVPVDKRLTAACPKVLPRDRSVEEAVRVARARGDALDQCNRQLDEIRETH